jgi:hypothetical protein
MAQYCAPLKNARMQQTLNYIDAAATPAHLKVYTADWSTLLIDFLLSKPSFSLSGDTLTLLGTPVGAAGLAVGLAGAAKIYDGDGNLVVDQLSCGTENANIVLVSKAISVGQPNEIQSGTIIHG